MASCLNDITQPIKLQYLNLGENTVKSIAAAMYLSLCALSWSLGCLEINVTHLLGPPKGPPLSLDCRFHMERIYNLTTQYRPAITEYGDSLDAFGTEERDAL